VLANQIAIYRQIFTLSMASARKLDAATQRFLEVPDCHLSADFHTFHGQRQEAGRGHTALSRGTRLSSIGRFSHFPWPAPGSLTRPHSAFSRYQIAIYRQIFALSMASARKLDAATQRFLKVPHCHLSADFHTVHGQRQEARCSHTALSRGTAAISLKYVLM
jgi:hypothetical protein